MFDSLMALIAQYADVKSKINQPYGEDDRLVLGQLADAIASMYESMNRAGDKDAKHLASCWHDVSEAHFPSSFTGKRDEENARDRERRSCYGMREYDDEWLR